ncbi:phospholipase [Paramagnetospirillum marisnigri]|uniref:Phospholipase n=1 Tax=Paramagnetospirillum marisnigri TaxID=1285242 RepID=A0A178MH51_9PROT|nr:dienelactone hydrolase family protein [Paramagnetospirillum marisnigri]OAN47986.1 phospholipase [Paramagnetospirillum marisnigri]
MPSHPPTLTGPSVDPASGGPAAQLVVLLHGVGVDGSDLIELAPFLATILPDAAFVAPDAPQAFDMAPFGRQWFSLQDRTSTVIAAGVRETAPILDAFIDEQLAKWGVGESDLALVGFSQGTMMALHVALRRAKAPAAVVGFSGALVDAASLPAEITARPRVLLIHGEDDEVVNPASLPTAEQALTSVGVPVLTELRPGLGHGIDGPGAQLALRFLGQAFGI